MKRAWSDGTQTIEFSPTDFVGKLAALVPPARKNQIVYKGVLAGNSALRREVVPRPPRVSPAERRLRRSRKLSRKPGWRRLGWADLLQRVFGVDGLRCKHCNGPLHLRCVVVNPPATMRVLAGLQRARAPPRPPLR